MGRGTLSNADCKLRAFCKLQTTSYKLRATCRFQKPPPHPSPKGRGRCFAVINPWINGAAWAPARGCSAPLAGDLFSPFHWLNSDSPDEAGPAGRDPGSMPHESPRLCRRRPVRAVVPFATSCVLRAIPSPSPHTTNNALRTRGADTWVRPYDKTHHEPQTTCRELSLSSPFEKDVYRLFFVIPAKRAFWLARAGIQTGAVFVARRGLSKQL